MIGRAHYATTTSTLRDPPASLRPAVRVIAQQLAASFVPSYRDAGTDEFIAGCVTSSWLDRLRLAVRIWFSELLQVWAGWSRTDANA